MYQYLMIQPDGGEDVIYNDPQFPFRCVDGNLSGFFNYTAGCHWHNDFEILLPRHGQIEYFVNGSVVRVNQGQAIFVNANRLHYGFSSRKEECLYTCFVFHPDIFGQTFANQKLHKLMSDTSSDFFIFQETEIIHILEHIYTLYDKREPFFELSVLAACCELVRRLCIAMDLETTYVEADSSWTSLRQMIGYLQTNYARTIRLEEIAAAGAVCRSKCCQLFREKIGTTPMTYLNRYRLEKARELLLTADASITEISHICGFESPSYFSDQFKRAYGVSPKQMRKRI